MSTVLFFALLPASPVAAHDPWISVAQDADGAQSFRLNLGHRFPEDGRIDPSRLEGIRLVRADGSTEALHPGDADRHPLPAGQGDGASLIVAEMRPTYWSRTFEGGREASRERYPDAFSCSQTWNVMKAIAGEGAGSAWKHRQGHALELMPLNDPAMLAGGDPFSVRVLLHGEPWEGEIKATHAGFAGAAEEDYALSVRTDAQGAARFVPAVSGYWLLRAYAAEDYPDPAVCDRRFHYSTLTFRVR